MQDILAVLSIISLCYGDFFVGFNLKECEQSITLVKGWLA